MANAAINVNLKIKKRQMALFIYVNHLEVTLYTRHV